MSHPNSIRAGTMNDDNDIDQTTLTIPLLTGNSFGNLHLQDNSHYALLTFNMDATEIIDIQRKWNTDYRNRSTHRSKLESLINIEKENAISLFNNQVKCDECHTGPFEIGPHRDFGPRDHPGMVEVWEGWKAIEAIFGGMEFHYLQINQGVMDKVNEMFRDLVVKYRNLKVDQTH